LKNFSFLLLLLFAFSCSQTGVEEKINSIKAGDSIDSLIVEKSDWEKNKVDSIAVNDSTSYFYFCGPFIVKLPKDYILEHAQGVDFTVYRTRNDVDTFGFFLGRFPNLPSELNFLTEQDPEYHNQVLNKKLELLKSSHGHYVKEISAFDSIDKNNKTYYSEMYFEIIDQNSRRLWIRKPIEFNRKEVTIAIEYKDKKIKNISHIFGSYKDSASFASMLKFASTIAPRNINVRKH
jgi:hypothetical protein